MQSTSAKLLLGQLQMELPHPSASPYEFNQFAAPSTCIVLETALAETSDDV
jgi:hypothetical protein